MDSKSTLTLAKAIQAKRSRVKHGTKGESYVVGVKRGAKYPAGRQNKKGDLTAVKIGRQLEYGTKKRPPMSWLRKAFDAKGQAALNLFASELRQRTQKAIDKVARQNRNKP